MAPKVEAPGLRRARPPLVIVAMADDADAKALRERVVQQPLERAPGGMHFDSALEASVVRRPISA